jgi:hypothetical protein
MGWLPTAIAQTSGIVLQDVDYVVDPQNVKATSTGTATVSYDQVEGGYYWRVERIVVTTTATVQTTVSVYVGDTSLPINLRDSTPLPVGYSAVAEYPAYLTVPGGQQLQVVVSGGAAGDAVTSTVQYRLVQRVAGG